MTIIIDRLPGAPPADMLRLYERLAALGCAVVWNNRLIFDVSCYASRRADGSWPEDLTIIHRDLGGLLSCPICVGHRNDPLTDLHRVL